MSNNEQLFAEIIPSEEANLSGGCGPKPRNCGGCCPIPNFLSAANANSHSAAVGGVINDARTNTRTLTGPGFAVSGSDASALTIG